MEPLGPEAIRVFERRMKKNASSLVLMRLSRRTQARFAVFFFSFVGDAHWLPDAHCISAFRSCTLLLAD